MSLVLKSNRTLQDIKKYNVSDNSVSVVLNLFSIKSKLKKTKEYFKDLNIKIEEFIELLKVVKKVNSVNRILISKRVKTINLLNESYNNDNELQDLVNESIDLVAIASACFDILNDFFDGLDIIDEEKFFK